MQVPEKEFDIPTTAYMASTMPNLTGHNHGVRLKLDNGLATCSEDVFEALTPPESISNISRSRSGAFKTATAPVGIYLHDHALMPVDHHPFYIKDTPPPSRHPSLVSDYPGPDREQNPDPITAPVPPGKPGRGGSVKKKGKEYDHIGGVEKVRGWGSRRNRHLMRTRSSIVMKHH